MGPCLVRLSYVILLIKSIELANNMSILATSPDFQVPRFPVRRFSVEEYHRMIQGGILADGDPVELLQGWIVPKMSRKLPHDAILDLANEALLAILPKGWRLRIQSAITTTDSEPEPDLAMARGPANRYLTRHPRPEDIAMVVEVSESSLDKDRHEKGPVYAQAGIPWYWIINLIDNVIEVYSQPEAREGKHAYQKMEIKGPGDFVPLIINGIEVGHLAVRDILVLAKEP